jgi:hypothetical protein
MVRNARLPHTMKRRVAAKAVLQALAHRCHDDGTNARPSLDTIGGEVELGRKTVASVLATLEEADLIVEEVPPTQHRPRVWSLNLARIAALADAQHDARLTSESATHDRAPLPDSDTQHVAPLDVSAERAPDAQIGESGAQIRASDAHAGAHERSLERSLERRTAASPLHTLAEKRYAALSREPADDDNFSVIVRISHEVIEKTGCCNEADPNLLEDVKTALSGVHIVHGRAGVSHDVVARALTCACMQRKLGFARRVDSRRG